MLKPVRDLVYIAPIYDSDTTESGLIYVPDVAKKRCDQGIVKFAGPEVTSVAIGDYVLFPNYTGTLMLIENVPYIIMREEYITAIMDLEHRNLEIEGLFLRESVNHNTSDEFKGMYFPATFDSIFQLVTESLSDLPQFKAIRMAKNPRQQDER